MIYLDIACAAVQVHVEVLNLAVLGELFGQVLLCCLFVNAGHKHNPALDGCGVGWGGGPRQRCLVTNELVRCLQRAARVSDALDDSTLSNVC